MISYISRIVLLSQVVVVPHCTVFVRVIGIYKKKVVKKIIIQTKNITQKKAKKIKNYTEKKIRRDDPKNDNPTI